MEYRGVEHIRPDWRMMDQFFFDMIAPALDLDSLTTSHPISVDVKDPKEIEAIFDKISYKKANTTIHKPHKINKLINGNFSVIGRRHNSHVGGRRG